MITALQADKLEAANLLLTARRALYSASQSPCFGDDDSTALRNLSSQVDSYFHLLINNESIKEPT